MIIKNALVYGKDFNAETNDIIIDGEKISSIEKTSKKVWIFQDVLPYRDLLIFISTDAIWLMQPTAIPNLQRL